MNKHLITREIGIDMGHRVTYHGSKCRNLHGHRYTIQATCSGPLFTEGEQQGMVLDFGFLKDEMMKHIDEPCDHGMCLWLDDPILVMFKPERWTHATSWLDDVQEQLFENAYVEETGSAGKLYIVPFVPTAENLAKHWFGRLAPAIKTRSNDQASLVKIKVWETPNCSAEYPAHG